MSEPKKPTGYASAMDWCKFYKAMDEHHGTSPDSPLHHDQRCVLQYRDAS